MELSIGEMLTIALIIIVLFGPKKLPQIAREFGEAVRKMKGAVEDIKTEILKETDEPINEIKKEIEKVKANNVFEAKTDLEKEKSDVKEPKIDKLSDGFEGPVNR